MEQTVDTTKSKLLKFRSLHLPKRKYCQYIYDQMYVCTYSHVYYKLSMKYKRLRIAFSLIANAFIGLSEFESKSPRAVIYHKMNQTNTNIRRLSRFIPWSLHNLILDIIIWFNFKYHFLLTM